MNTQTTTAGTERQPDWNLVRAFLAVVDAGSLTGATRLLASSQPTLSRQINELETSMGVALFERMARGLRLTAAGEVLVPHARQMQAAAHGISMAALGQTQELAGTVRITASEMTSAYMLPPVVATLRRQYPQIQLELLASNQLENLLEREADIAIRHTRPTQTGLIAQRVGMAAMGAFAHEDYLERVGGHIDMARAADYDWIGHDRSGQLIRGFREAGYNVERSFFCFRSDNHVQGWQMALAGAGIAFAAEAIALKWPFMRAALPPATLPDLPVWVSAHRELRQSARIRVVFDALVRGLAGMVRPGPDVG